MVQYFSMTVILLSACIDTCHSCAGFTLKVSRLESERLCICFPGKSPIGGDRRVWLHLPDATRLISTSVCLIQPFQNSFCFLPACCGKLTLKSHSRWARERRNMSHVWMSTGSRSETDGLFWKHPPFTCRLQQHRGKNVLLPLCMPWREKRMKRHYF